MHAANGVRMHAKGQVLMHAGLAPEDAGRVWVRALIGTYPLQLAHTPHIPLLTSKRDERRCPTVCSHTRFQSPASQVMRTGHHAGTDAFSHPGPIDIVANFCGDTHEIARRHAYAFRITRMNPHGVRIGDLIEPLRVARTRMDQCRQTEGGDKQVLAPFGIDVGGMDMAMNVARRGIFRPAPFFERGRVELQLA